ncbi:MAG: prepilin-type N-terminal cleavage/methylation domain-containing protein [bacterium]|nr:prepilin-type N-terminal cleavage/methylation domain-containing protein [bacterium]
MAYKFFRASRKEFTPLETLARKVLNDAYSNPYRNRKFLTGFTLIELLVVIAIIGLLTSVIIGGLTIARQRARDTRRVADLRQVKTGLDLYLQEAGGYPAASFWVAGGLISCTQATTRVPTDPLIPTYSYTYTEQGTGMGNSICSGNPNVYPGYRVTFYIENENANFYMNQEGNAFNSSTNAPVSWDDLLK